MALGQHNLTYHPRFHITAGQLRELGFYLCEMIPDEDFVRREAVGLDDGEEFYDDSATLRLRVREPFRNRRSLALTV